MKAGLEVLVAKATEGDSASLDAVLRGVKDDVYGLAMRMLGHPADAEDATQEVLVKVATHLATFRGESAFRTWVFRVASNHLLRVKKSRREEIVTGFGLIEACITEGETIDPVSLPDAEANLLAEEVKVGCTQAMMLALGRDERIAYTLGEVFGLSSEDAAAILGIDQAAFRKRLSRARDALAAFMGKKCGLVTEESACRCARQIPVNLRHDFIDREHLLYMTHAVRSARLPAPLDELRSLGELEAIAEVFRTHPDYAAPESVLAGVRALVASGRIDPLAGREDNQGR
jgi:RNA polymerase sigma factor (sigma-70 family)